jgi:1-acyl-sn-glycerol-3-phosphate acyltransferase
MITKYLARFAFWIMGWKVKMLIPPEKKYVVIIAPHTSNWDFLFGKLANWSCGQKTKVLVKKEAFKFLVAPFIKMWGGVPIDRKNTENIVDQVIRMFDKNDKFVLGITPEGTRKRNPDWKTGFYRIAYKANVPIYFGYIDFGKKAIGMHDFIFPGGDMEKDIQQIKFYYKDMKGYYPEQFAI